MLGVAVTASKTCLCLGYIGCFMGCLFLLFCSFFPPFLLRFCRPIFVPDGSMGKLKTFLIMLIVISFRAWVHFSKELEL